MDVRIQTYDLPRRSREICTFCVDSAVVRRIYTIESPWQKWNAQWESFHCRTNACRGENVLYPEAGRCARCMLPITTDDPLCQLCRIELSGKELSTLDHNQFIRHTALVFDSRKAQNAVFAENINSRQRPEPTWLERILV